MIDLKELLSPERTVDLIGTEKEAVIDELLAVISQSGRIVDREAFRQALLKREQILSTGIGFGIAIPHAKVSAVSDFVIAIGRSEQGVAFDAFDSKPVHIVVMIGASERQKDDYIKVLAKLSAVLKNPELRTRILQASSPEAVYRIFVENTA